MILFMGVLLFVLFVLNRVYLNRNKKIEKERLEKVQLHLFGYVGECDEGKKEELYNKYLEVNNKLV